MGGNLSVKEAEWFQRIDADFDQMRKGKSISLESLWKMSVPTDPVFNINLYHLPTIYKVCSAWCYMVLPD
jgi:hypothetical protein